MTAKSHFVKYMGVCHLNYLNIEARAFSGGAVHLVPVHVGRSARLAPAKTFPSMEDAQAWYDSLPGNDLGRLDNGLDALLPDRY